MEISVIIPVYNASKWIEKLWKSLLEQTIFDKLEFIFVNDGSTDNSLDILRKIQKNSENVKVINQTNHGVSFARNVGINNSKCNYITFIDSDDYLDNDYFEHLLVNSKNTDITITGFVNEYGAKSVEKKPLKYEILKGNKELVKAFLIGKIEPNSTNKLFNRKLIGELRFNESYAIAEDKLFVFKYITNAKSASFIPEAKYHYNHLNENAVTKSTFNKKTFAAINVSEEIIENIKKQYSELIEYALSADNDVRCRIYCEMYKSNATKEYSIEFKNLKKNIRKYSLLKKIKFSSKKHIATLVLAKISPKVYLFFKDRMKMQYK